MMGIKEIYIDDLREEFVRDYVFPMFRANAIYEGVYLLGTSIARPLIAKRQIEIAEEVGADAVCHGATGKGNDQVRFELGYYALQAGHQGHRALARMGPDQSRTDLIDYAEKHQIPVPKDKRGESAVLRRRQPAAHLVRGQGARGPVVEARRTTSDPQRTVDAGWTRPTPRPMSSIDFEQGDPVAIDGEKGSRRRRC